MAYQRVLPRDLFNEASLLKCYGRLWIILDETRGHTARFVEEDVEKFEIDQRHYDGATFVCNVTFEVGGREYLLTRPLNSRADWPLYAEALDDLEADHVAVFDYAGNLSTEMRRLIMGGETPS